MNLCGSFLRLLEPFDDVVNRLIIFVEVVLHHKFHSLSNSDSGTGLL